MIMWFAENLGVLNEKRCKYIRNYPTYVLYFQWFSIVVFWSNLLLKGCVLVQPFVKRLLKGCFILKLNIFKYYYIYTI